LLAIKKELTHTFKERRKLADALLDVKEQLYIFKQGKYISLQRYYELFLSQVEVMDQVGVTLEDQSLVEAIAISSGRQQPNDADRKESREQSLAMRFIRGTNKRHKNYLAHLRNSFLDGSDIYPETALRTPGIQHIITSWTRYRTKRTTEWVFTNVGAEDSGGEHKKKDHIICCDCGDEGHYANRCPKRNNENIGQQNEDKFF
jgi:hypothetical protein